MNSDSLSAPAAAAQCGCANCGAILHGPFCFACGQESLERPYSLRAFLMASLSDILNFRSRTLRSLVDLVVRPGEVTAAYFAGKRVRYTQPVQLYLIAAATFFFANSFHPFLAITDDNWVVSSLGLTLFFNIILIGWVQAVVEFAQRQAG